jgi:hypothetical protein
MSLVTGTFLDNPTQRDLSATKLSPVTTISFALFSPQQLLCSDVTFPLGFNSLVTYISFGEGFF